MYTLHETFMPIELQNQLRENIESTGPRGGLRPSLVHEAKEWFSKTVTKISGKEVFHVFSQLLTNPYPGIEGRSVSGDIHADATSQHRNKRKFLINIAKEQRQGTMFFSSLPGTGDVVFTDELFERNASGALAVSPHIKVDFIWEQAAIGQLVSFDVNTQLHAAAPHYEGDRKYLLSTVVSLTAD